MENLFALFEIEEQIKLEPKVVLEKYYQLSKQFHPDHNKSISTNQEEQIKLLEKSSSINQAKNIFLNQDKIIDYILSYRYTKTTTLPPDFLMEMLEVNESIEDAKSANDSNKIESLQKKIATMIASLGKNFAQDIENYNVNMDNREACLKNLDEYRLKKKYLERMQINLTRDDEEK